MIATCGESRAMRRRHVEQTTLTTFLVAACAMLFVAAYMAIADAQNPSTQPGMDTNGLPPNDSIFGLANTTSPAAC